MKRPAPRRLRGAPARAMAVASLLLASACAGLPQPQPAPGAPVDADATRAGVERAIDMLGNGDIAGARAELTGVLRREPANGPARELVDELDKDPRQLFGDRNFTYKVRPGETVMILAERYLGDRLLFYALARYNGLASPSDLAIGQSLNIPSVLRPPVSPSPRRPPATTIARPAPTPASAPTPPPLHDPDCAARLRARALDEMSGGLTDAAVSHLREALQCDAGNDLARHDLDRALRLQTLAHGH